MSEEPRRLLDDPDATDPAVRALLKTARAYRPPEVLRQRLTARVLLGLGIGGTATAMGASVAAATATATATATKVWLVVGTVAVIATGGTYLAVKPVPRKPDLTQLSAPHPTPTIPSRVQAKPVAEVAEPPVEAPRVAAAAPPIRRRSVEPIAPIPAVPHDLPQKPQEITAAPSLAQELSVLNHARRSLRAGDPRGALEHLDRRDREFPTGSLRLESEILRLESLARLGARAELTRRARAFLIEHPRSALADRVRVLLQTEGEP